METIEFNKRIRTVKFTAEDLAAMLGCDLTNPYDIKFEFVGYGYEVQRIDVAGLTAMRIRAEEIL